MEFGKHKISKMRKPETGSLNSFSPVMIRKLIERDQRMFYRIGLGHAAKVPRKKKKPQMP